MARSVACVIMAGPANRRIQVATETRHLMTTAERIGRAVMWVAVSVVVLALIGWVSGFYQAVRPPPLPSPTPPAATRPTPMPAPSIRRPVALQPAPASPAAPAALDLTPVERGLGQVAEAVREIRQSAPTSGADQFGQPLTTPRPAATDCNGLAPAEARRCRLWNQQ